MNPFNLDLYLENGKVWEKAADLNEKRLKRIKLFNVTRRLLGYGTWVIGKTGQ